MVNLASIFSKSKEFVFRLLPVGVLLKGSGYGNKRLFKKSESFGGSEKTD
jgi:hypothetical protein